MIQPIIASRRPLPGQFQDAGTAAHVAGAGRGAPVFDALSRRERETLALLWPAA